jgi:hypothetical protein
MELENKEQTSDYLNDDWITDFEKTDKLYEDFYKDDLYYTNVHYIYINRSNEIEKIKQESFLFSVKNRITREELLGILKNNSIQDTKKYSLLSILKYNITLDPNDITKFLNSVNDETFLKPVTLIDEVYFDKSINMLHDLNDVLFLFYEKSNELKNKNSRNMTTKMQSLTNSNKKTIKKQYKD